MNLSFCKRFSDNNTWVGNVAYPEDDFDRERVAPLNDILRVILPTPMIIPIKNARSLNKIGPRV